MIEISNLEKKLADFTVRDINLNIRENEYFVILGPTGTGKTVLLELIAGLLEQDRGVISIGGEVVNKLPPEERNIGMVYQDYMLFPHLDVRGNICFGLNVRGYKQDKIERELNNIVKLFAIEHLLEREVGTLSGGEQQRVALARALITTPDVLLLDEPLSALDPATKEKFQEDLKRLHTELKTTTLHITHDFNEALALADRIGVMDNGRLVQVGKPDKIFQEPASNLVAEFVGARNIFQGQIIEKNGDKYVKVTGDLYISVITPGNGNVNLAIRPEDIIISYESMESSARNTFSGRVVRVKDKLSVVEVTVDIGIRLTIYITRHSLEVMDLKPGKRVFVTFKASAVHVF